MCAFVQQLLKGVRQERWSSKKIGYGTAFQCENDVSDRNKEIQKDPSVKPGQTYHSVGGLIAAKPLCLWRISPLTVMYIEHCFLKRYKFISAALLDILCLCVLTTGSWAQTQTAKMHVLSPKGMDEVFSSESLLKRRAHCMSLSVNGPCSSTPLPHFFSAPASPAGRKLLHMHRSQYVQTYPFGGSSRV